MKAAPKIAVLTSTISLLLCALPLLSAFADDSEKEEPQVVRDLRAKLSSGWSCVIYQGDDVKVVPLGLGKPLFQVVASNTNLSLVKFPDAPRPTMQSPIIPLYFYRHSEKADIMKIIEKESNLSSSIPIYFGETDEFVVVTSPAFVNGGLFTPEARHALRPMWKVLRDLIPKSDKTGIDVDDLAADAVGVLAADVKPLGEHILPTMTIPKALQIADRYVADQKLDVSKHFISSVRYHESGALTQTYIGKGPCWQVTYELRQNADGGQFFILVYMDQNVGGINGL